MDIQGGLEAWDVEDIQHVRNMWLLSSSVFLLYPRLQYLVAQNYVSQSRRLCYLAHQNPVPTVVTMTTHLYFSR